MGLYKWPREYPCKTTTYSLKKVGNKQLSAHFNLKEFQSKDGADTIVICPDLINLCLEPLFNLMNAKAINITSGYRTISHSKAIGGSGATDNHHMGMAADIKVKKQDGTYYTAKEVACALQDLGWKHGIGLMATSVHVDTGSQYWFDETKKSGGKYVQVADWHQYTGISKVLGESVKPSTPAPTPTPTPAPRTYKYKVGDNVTFSTCYKSSTAPNSEAIAASKMSRNHGVITKIVDAKNPYLLDNGFCWVNDGDIRGYYKAGSSTKTEVKPAAPSKPSYTRYRLNCNKIYARAAKKPLAKIMKTYYRGEILNVVKFDGNWAELDNGLYINGKKYLVKVG